MNRQEAEAHWKFTEGVVLKMLEVTHYTYVEALLHGDKHGKEDKDDMP